MTSELDDELNASIGAAANTSGDPDVEAGLEALAATEKTAVEIKIPSGSESPKRKRRSKSELETALDEKEKEVEGMKVRLESLEARTDTRSVDDLGSIIAFAITLAGDATAAKRGAHWQFSEEEAGRNGAAWAYALAPYAERLKHIAPWAIALQVTWLSMRPRLEQDKLLLARPAGETAGNGQG